MESPDSVRYLIVSDMHGNWEAFQAVLRRIRRKRFDVTLMLGDVVGYGASPNKVVEAVRNDLPGALWSVRGNHDKVVAGIDLGENFNEVALAAARWTAERLSSENLRYVEELPQGPLEVVPGTAICHGSPLDEDAYVFSDYDAYEIFSAAEHQARLTFFGHTHVPSIFAISPDGIEVAALRDSGAMELSGEARYLINPGSIGQPRDRDPRAAYMTYDDAKSTLRWYRVPYPVDEAQARIRKAGLPPLLAERLAVGI